MHSQPGGWQLGPGLHPLVEVLTHTVSLAFFPKLLTSIQFLRISIFSPLNLCHFSLLAMNLENTDSTVKLVAANARPGVFLMEADSVITREGIHR